RRRNGCKTCSCRLCDILDWRCGGAARMIAFILRFFILVMVFATFAMNIFVFLLGQPQEETWRFLWENDDYSIPIVAVIAMIATTTSFFISLWISIALKMKENQMTRIVKKVAEPDF